MIDPKKLAGWKALLPLSEDHPDDIEYDEWCAIVEAIPVLIAEVERLQDIKDRIMQMEEDNEA